MVGVSGCFVVEDSTRSVQVLENGMEKVLELVPNTKILLKCLMSR